VNHAISKGFQAGSFHCHAPGVEGLYGQMSIVTKTGDQGTTGLMYNRRVPKCSPRIEAYGAVDELNAALGLARVTATHEFTRDALAAIQKDLITLMGELATSLEDLPRYLKDGFSLVDPKLTASLEEKVMQVESQGLTFKDWVIPGANLHSSALDVARTVCRRAERRVCELHQSGELQNAEPMVYLNRLSDLLWLMARWEEQAKGKDGTSNVEH
jgi:cob(I)alamin adenosyltransferase